MSRLRHDEIQGGMAGRGIGKQREKKGFGGASALCYP